MPRNAIPTRRFRIYRRPDGRYETRNESPTDSPLGVDMTLGMAMGTVAREAALASRAGCQVIIEVQQQDGSWKQAAIIDPPADE